MKEKSSKLERRAPLECPVCARTCLGPQGLVAHLSAKHPEFYQDPAPEPGKAPRITVKLPKVEPVLGDPAGTQVLAGLDLSPRDLIDAAIAKLRDKLANVRDEIARLGHLQADEADLARQLDEVTKSRAAFSKPEDAITPATAAFLLNEQHELPRNAKATRPKTRSAAG